MNFNFSKTNTKSNSNCNSNTNSNTNSISNKKLFLAGSAVAIVHCLQHSTSQCVLIKQPQRNIY